MATRLPVARRHAVVHHAGPVALIVAAVALLTRYSLSDLTSTLPRNLGDAALNTWILAWQSHALVSEPARWFDGDVFAGHGSALGYSEIMLPQLVVYAPVYWIGRNPVLAHNVTLLAELGLALGATYALALRLRVSRWAAASAALGLTMSSFVVFHLGHLQLLAIGLFPLGLLALLAMLRRRRVRDGVWLGVVSFALVTGCLYYAAAWVPTVALVVLVDLLAHRGRPGRDWWTTVAAGGLCSAALIAPIGLLYLRFQAQVGFSRPVDSSLGAAPGDLLAPSAGSYVYRSLGAAAATRPSADERSFFPGMLLLSLGLVAVFVLVARLRRPGRVVRSDWMVLGVLALVASTLAFGPELSGFPTPFRLLAQHLPGLSSIRVPGRLVGPLLVVIVVAGARVLDGLTERLALPALTRPAVVLLVAAELLTSHPRAAVIERPDVEAMYAALAAQPAGGVVELPAASLADGAPGVYLEAERMLRSIGTWRPRINGTSGGDPPGFAQEVVLYNTFPAAPAVTALKSKGIRFAIVHVGDGQPFHVTEAEATAIPSDPSLHVVGRFGEQLLVDLGP